MGGQNEQKRKGAAKGLDPMIMSPSEQLALNE